MTAVRNAASMPYALTFRNMAQILDQGSSNSCEGHGWAQALYLRGLISKVAIPMPSPAFLYACALQYDAGVAEVSLDAPRPALQDGGTFGRTVGFILKSRGVVSNDDYPLDRLLDARDGSVKYPPLGVLEKAGDELVTEVAWLPDSSTETALEVCRAVARGFPLTFGMHVSKQYQNLKPGEIYRGPDSNSDPDIGGHCQCIVGYNTEERWIEVANSWGTDFCDGGFARISFDAVNNSEICSEFAALTLSPTELE